MAKIVSNFTKPVEVVVRILYQIKLWDAIKLRIAGENYKMVADEILKTLGDNK